MTPIEADAVAEDILDLGHVLFRRASWKFYELILHHRDRLGHKARITYDTGLMEIFFGAGVQYALRESLAKFLENFKIDRDAPLVHPQELSAQRSAKKERDEIYVVHFMPVLADGAGMGKRVERSRESVIEITVGRSCFASEGDWNLPAEIGPAQFRMRGYVKACLTGSDYNFAEQSAVFPGISVNDHFESVYFEKKVETKP